MEPGQVLWRGLGGVEFTRNPIQQTTPTRTDPRNRPTNQPHTMSAMKVICFCVFCCVFDDNNVGFLLVCVHRLPRRPRMKCWILFLITDALMYAIEARKRKSN